MSYVRRTTILFTCAWVSLVQTQATMAVENFFVKSATYSRASAFFELRASIPANDSASVVITAKKDEAKRIVDGLTTSVPAIIATSTTGDAGKENTSISVTVRTATAVDVSLSYSTCASGVECEKDALTIHYNVNQTETETLLDGFARVRDASKSNAKWSGATLVVQRGAIGNLKFDKIDMDVGNTIVLPIPSLTKYPVTLEELSDTVVLSDTTHDVIEITNVGDTRKETLQNGEVRLLNAGVFWHATRLDKDLKHGEKAKLIAGVSEKVVSTLGTLKQDQWYEAIALDGGRLKYKTWSVQPITLENKTDRPIKVIVDPASNPINIPASKVKVRDIAVTFGSELEKDLKVFTEPELKEHTKRLAEVRKVSGSVTRNKVDTIRFNLNSILQAITLGASQTAIADTINDLTKAGAPGTELDYWREQLQITENLVREAEVSSAVAKSTLEKLFESPSASQVQESTAATFRKFSSPLAGFETAPFAALTRDR